MKKIRGWVVRIEVREISKGQFLMSVYLLFKGFGFNFDGNGKLLKNFLKGIF